MKKKILCGAALFLVLVGAVFANRPEVEEAITSYEAIVVEAEKLAEMPLVTANDFSAIDGKAQAAESKIAAIENETEWLIQDARRVAELRTRFNQAMATTINKLIKY